MNSFLFLPFLTVPIANGHVGKWLLETQVATALHYDNVIRMIPINH